jgi:isoleucyl-tRNA synthetase
MSKSVGNTIEPQEIIAKSGAEVLRLWAAMVDYREEVRIGPEILARVVEAYLKLRNTLRILAANLYDFQPETDAVPVDQLEELDRFALARYGEVASRILQAYEAYDFPAIPQALNALVTVDLSAFYVDVSKDRLYTLAPKSAARRSAQTAMFTIVDGLARLIAPILPFTSDELWRFLPGRREDSVHLALFPADPARLADEALVLRWERLLKLREAVNVELERLRQAKVVGKSLEARVSLRPRGELAALIERYRDVLPTLFIVSEVTVHGDEAQAGAAAYEESESSGAGITVGRAAGVRCDRCWRYVPRVSTGPTEAGLCERCESAVAEAHA